MDAPQVDDIVAEADALYKETLAGTPDTRAVVRTMLRWARTRARSADVAVVEGVVRGLRAVASEEHEALRNASALPLLDRAVDLAESAGLAEQVGASLATRVSVHLELGRPGPAEADRARAAVVAPSLRPELDLMRARFMLERGDVASAAQAYRRLIHEDLLTARGKAVAANNLAHIETELGRSGEAVLWADAAIEAAGDGSALLPYLRQTRAWALMHAGRLSESLREFEIARALFDEAGLPPGEFHLEYADVLTSLRLDDEARAALTEGLAQLDEGDAPLLAADAHLRLARLAARTGDVATAQRAGARAAALFRSQGRTTWAHRARVARAQARVVVGTATAADRSALRTAAAALAAAGLVADAAQAHLLAASGGRPDRRRADLVAARDLARTGPLLLRLTGRVAAARLAADDHAPGAVLRECRAGLRELDAYRAALPTMELRAHASGHGAELGRSGLRALLADGRPGVVLDWLERTRAAAIAPVAVQATPDAQDEVREAAAHLRALYAEREEARRETGAEPPGLLRRIAAAERRVRRASWTAAVSTATDPDQSAGGAPVAARLRPVLADAGAVLVEYAEADGDLVAVVVDRRRTRLVRLGPAAPVREDVEAVAFALTRLASPALPAPLARAGLAMATTRLDRLRDRLAGPLGLDPGRPLVVVPVGSLQRVPWSALHHGVVTVAPSATAWLRSTRAADRGAGHVAVVTGPGLPGAVAETAAVAAVHEGRARVLGPQESTAEATLDLLRGAALAHVASHATARTDNPMFTALRLADGPLTVHEIVSGATVPDRVVLAACEAGLEVPHPGEETLGLVSALLAGGARAVLASSVLVPDAAAVPLMERVHVHLAAGATLAAAVHAARAETTDDDHTGLVARTAFTAYGAA